MVAQTTAQPDTSSDRRPRDGHEGGRRRRLSSHHAAHGRVAEPPLRQAEADVTVLLWRIALAAATFELTFWLLTDVVFVSP